MLLDLTGQTALEPKHESEKSVAYLEPYIDVTDNADVRRLYGEIPAIQFQYWPESLSDSKDSAWEERRIPGLSHPLYHWSSGGARTLSFTAMMARDNDPDEMEDIGVVEALIGGRGDKHLNYDLEAAVAWLRSFQLPTYTEDGDFTPLPPPKLFLVFHGMRLGLNGQMGVLCYMASCEITSQAWFPGGKLRYIEANLSFIELMQRDQLITTVSRKALTLQTRYDERLPIAVPHGRGTT